MSELISMCVQEEERLKSEQPDNDHVAITIPSKGKGKKFGKGNVQGNKSASITKTDKASSSGTKGSSGPRCHFCKDKGHMRKECHKFREWLEKKGHISRGRMECLIEDGILHSLDFSDFDTCIEYAEYSGSCTPRIINIEEIQDHVSIPVIQKVGAPLPHRKGNDAPEVVPNDVPLITDPTSIPVNEQPLRRLYRLVVRWNFDSWKWANFEIRIYLQLEFALGMPSCVSD
ncbi:hypothetical protein RJ639_038426 [Escallonia herrerae]|uniref:CCHC-type domain-containing protein n=1 Tax=Escallonia herrerae TaxID=1293975 RepID=A0AA88WLE3_9ASTE|nr:hypothetical protein RJ639_038426 [Escallonia herrerae]